METIFGLLFILLPVIFKLIGKKLEQSGKTGPIVEVLSETFDESSDEPASKPVAKPIEKPVEKPVVEFKPVPMPVYRPPKVEENVIRQTESLIQVEQEKKPAAEKIDPKKLVIYSEIMKPKFTE